MAWSTRQLADLAGTTVKTVRHYHDVGLLDLPERAPNGYKQYAVSHLVRLLQVKRLRDLGVPISRIAALDAGDSGAAVRALDAELEARIDGLTRIREELAVISRHRAPLDVPPGFAPLSREMSRTQRELLAIYAAIFDEEAFEAFRRVVADADATDAEFDRLPVDADAAVVEDLAQRMAPVTRRVRAEHPSLVNPVAHSPHSPDVAAAVMAQALVELYHPAQLRVLARVHALLVDDEPAEPDGPGVGSPP